MLIHRAELKGKLISCLKESISYMSQGLEAVSHILIPNHSYLFIHDLLMLFTIKVHVSM